MARRFVFLCVLLASPALAQAEQFGLIINGFAYHLDRSKERNENNAGLGLQVDLAPRGGWVPFLSASGFNDSRKDMSYYAGAGLKKRYVVSKTLNNLYVDFGAAAFVMTRKSYRDNRPFPGILPVFSFGTDQFSINMTYIPEVTEKIVPLVFYQFVAPLN